MSKKLKLDRKIGFQDMFYIKCINVIIDNIGPSIILRSIFILKFEVCYEVCKPFSFWIPVYRHFGKQ